MVVLVLGWSLPLQSVLLLCCWSIIVPLELASCQELLCKLGHQGLEGRAPARGSAKGWASLAEEWALHLEALACSRDWGRAPSGLGSPGGFGILGGTGWLWGSGRGAV